MWKRRKMHSRYFLCDHSFCWLCFLSLFMLNFGFFFLHGKDSTPNLKSSTQAAFLLSTCWKRPTPKSKTLHGLISLTCGFLVIFCLGYIFHVTGPLISCRFPCFPSVLCSSVGVGGDGLHGVGAGNAARESSQPVGRSGGWEGLRAPGLSARRALPRPEQPH